DQVIAKGKIELLLPYLGIMIATTVLRTVLRYTYQMIFERIGQDVLFGIRQDLYKKLQELDFDYFNHNRVGDIMARMTVDTDAIQHFVAWVTYQVAECILYFVAALIMMSTIDFRLMLALLAVTPIIGFLTIKMSKEAQPVFFDIRESFSRLNSMVEEN